MKKEKIMKFISILFIIAGLISAVAGGICATAFSRNWCWWVLGGGVVALIIGVVVLLIKVLNDY